MANDTYFLAAATAAEDDAGALVPHPDSALGVVQRLYEVVLDRPADSDGLVYWAGQLGDAALDPVGVARGLMDSAEFHDLYGVTVQSIEGFIELVYRTALERDPDPAGLEYWADRRVEGLSEAEFMVHLANSDEVRAMAVPDPDPLALV